MRAEDILNFKAISAILTGKEDRIRKSAMANKYSEDIQELYDYVETWIKRKQGKYIKTGRKKWFKSNIGLAIVLNIVNETQCKSSFPLLIRLNNKKAWPYEDSNQIVELNLVVDADIKKLKVLEVLTINQPLYPEIFRFSFASSLVEIGVGSQKHSYLIKI